MTFERSPRSSGRACQREDLEALTTAQWTSMAPEDLVALGTDQWSALATDDLVALVSEQWSRCGNRRPCRTHQRAMGRFCLG
jgi:hypothetical protein